MQLTNSLGQLGKCEYKTGLHKTFTLSILRPGYELESLEPKLLTQNQCVAATA